VPKEAQQEAQRPKVAKLLPLDLGDEGKRARRRRKRKSSIRRMGTRKWKNGIEGLATRQKGDGEGS